MADLRRVLPALGYGQLQTYRRTGSPMVGSGDGEAAVRRARAASVLENVGHAVPVAVRTVAEIRAVVGACPFAADDGAVVYAGLLVDTPRPNAWARLREALAVPHDALGPGGRCVYPPDRGASTSRPGRTPWLRAVWVSRWRRAT